MFGDWFAREDILEFVLSTADGIVHHRLTEPTERWPIVS